MLPVQIYSSSDWSVLGGSDLAACCEMAVICKYVTEGLVYWNVGVPE